MSKSKSNVSKKPEVLKPAEVVTEKAVKAEIEKTVEVGSEKSSENEDNYNKNKLVKNGNEEPVILPKYSGLKLYSIAELLEQYEQAKSGETMLSFDLFILRVSASYLSDSINIYDFNKLCSIMRKDGIDVFEEELIIEGGL